MLKYWDDCSRVLADGRFALIQEKELVCLLVNAGGKGSQGTDPLLPTTSQRYWMVGIEFRQTRKAAVRHFALKFR